MDQNLDTLFSGKFYIDSSYGLGLVPSLISFFNGKNIVQKSESDKIKDVTKVMINVNYTIAQVDAALSDNTKKVVIISFKQPVVKYSTYYWLGTQSYISILETLKNDPNVLGVVVDTDSGGGQVYGTPEMYDAVKDFAAVKTIGFYTNGYLCSGAYYIAAPGTFIMANKRADAIGSIGGYTIIVNYEGIVEKLGGKVNVIYSDLSPDKNKGHRAVMAATDPENKAYITEELNPMVLTFHADMKGARPQLDEIVFKGGTWTGEQAMEKGLIDYNGSLNDAVAKVFELANDSSTNNNNNSKKETMSKTKSFPTIQKLIGVEGEGLAIVTSLLPSKTGVDISEEQLATIETELAGKEEAVNTANGKVTAAEGKVTAFETSVDAAIEAAGLTASVEANATTEQKITLLSTKVVEYGKRPATKATKTESSGDNVDDENAIVDAKDDHNAAYNKA